MCLRHSKLTLQAELWVVLSPRVSVVCHTSPAEGVCGALGAAGGSLRRARVRRQCVVEQAGRRWVGAQRQRLLQAAHGGAVSAGQGQELIPGVAARSGTAGVIFVAQTGRQAVGILWPAAGKARVEPLPSIVAREWSGLAVRAREAVVRLVVVAQAELRDGGVVYLSVEQGVTREGGVLWRRAAAVTFGGGARLVECGVFSLLFAHGLIVLFGRVAAAAAQVSAQVAEVTASERRNNMSTLWGSNCAHVFKVLHEHNSRKGCAPCCSRPRSPIWCWSRSRQHHWASSSWHPCVFALSCTWNPIKVRCHFKERRANTRAAMLAFEKIKKSNLLIPAHTPAGNVLIYMRAYMTKWLPHRGLFPKCLLVDAQVTK